MPAYAQPEAAVSRSRAELVSQRTLADGKVERTVRFYGRLNSYRDGQGEWRAANQRQTAPRPNVLAYADNPINVELDYQTGAITTLVPSSGSTTTMTLATINGRPVARPWTPQALADGTPGILVRNVAPNVDLEIRVMSDAIKQNLIVNGPEGMTAGNSFTASWDYTRTDTGTNDLRWLPPTVTFAKLTAAPTNVPITVTDTGTQLTYSLSYDGSNGWPLIIDPTETVGQNTTDDYTKNFHDNKMMSASGFEDDNRGAESNLLWFNGASNKQRMLLRGALSDIPSHALVSAASLNLYHEHGSCDTHNTTVSLPVHQILAANVGWIEGTKNVSPWTESGSSCWNDHTYDDTQEWAGSVGCGTSGTDYNGTSEGDLDFTTTAGYVSLTMTDLVQSWVDGTEVNAGLLILETGVPAPPTFVVAISSESTDAKRPYFEVTYTTPAGTGLIIQEGGTTVLSNAGVLDFADMDFDVTEAPDNEGNVWLAAIVSKLGASIESSEITDGTIATNDLATALNAEIDSAEEVTGGAADPPSLAVGVLYVETDKAALFAGNGTDVRDVADKRFATFFDATSVTKDAIQHVALPYGWNGIHIVEFKVTPATGHTDVDVVLHRADAGGSGDTEVWARYENWDASSGDLVDNTGLYYRDMDNTGELHITITEVGGGSGSYTVTVTGYGLERLAQ